MTTNTLNLFAGPMFLVTAIIWVSLGYFALGAVFFALALVSAVRFANRKAQP